MKKHRGGLDAGVKEKQVHWDSLNSSDTSSSDSEPEQKRSNGMKAIILTLLTGLIGGIGIYLYL